jgi:hypothetical protein
LQIGGQRVHIGGHEAYIESGIGGLALRQRNLRIADIHASRTSAGHRPRKRILTSSALQMQQRQSLHVARRRQHSIFEQ